MSAFLSVDLLTDFAAFCLTDFVDWRYIHSWFVFSTQLSELCPMDAGTILVYCCPSTLPSLWPPPPSPPSQCTVQYMQTVCDCGGGGGCRNALWAIFCRSFIYTLFLTRFRTYKIASPPQTKMTSKDDIKGLVSLKFLRPWCRPNSFHSEAEFMNVQFLWGFQAQSGFCMDFLEVGLVFYQVFLLSP